MALVGDFFKSAPRIPKTTPVNTQAEQAKTIAGNQANFSAAAQLAASANLFTVQQTEAMRQFVSGGKYAGLLGQYLSNTSDLLSGNRTAEETRQLRSEAAAGSLYSGSFGSLRDNTFLNLSSEDRSRRVAAGMTSFERWSSSIAPPAMDASAMFIRPETQVQIKLKENEDLFQRNYINALKNAEYSTGGRFASMENSILEAI